jgi:hypothetical protein
VIAAYLAWSEFFVQRFNDVPTGAVTSGLPYPFLNDMELPARLQFYGLNFGVALGFLIGFTILVLIFGPRRR